MADCVTALLLAMTFLLVIFAVNKCLQHKHDTQPRENTDTRLSGDCESDEDLGKQEECILPSPDQSHIRAQSTRASKPHIKHRERSKETATIAVCKTPGWINLQGALARTTDRTMYDQTWYELQHYRDGDPSVDLYTYMLNKFKGSRRDDMAVMSLIVGTGAARHMTGDTQQALTWCKQLQRDLHTYPLKNPDIAEAYVYWLKHSCYMHKDKPGKAHSALQAAVSCIQHQAPSTWTARVYELQGRMHDRLAQVSPGQRRQNQDLAMTCFINAREHCLYEASQEEDYLYYPIYYSLQKVHIKLDMPTIHTIRDFCDSEIVYQRRVSQCHVTEAQDMPTVSEISTFCTKMAKSDTFPKF